MQHLAALILVLATACSGSSTSSPGPASGSQQPPPSPTPSPAPGALDTAKLGQPCGDGGACAAPMECKKYYGIAGARGPQFATCEIECSDKSPCPEGTHCATIADGPGAVCRPH